MINFAAAVASAYLSCLTLDVAGIGLALVEAGNDFHHPPDIRGSVGDHQRVARRVGGQVGIGVHQRLKIRLQFHRVHAPHGNDLGDQFIGILDLRRIVAETNGNVGMLGIVQAGDLEQLAHLDRRQAIAFERAVEIHNRLLRGSRATG